MLFRSKKPIITENMQIEQIERNISKLLREKEILEQKKKEYEDKMKDIESKITSLHDKKIKQTMEKIVIQKHQEMEELKSAMLSKKISEPKTSNRASVIQKSTSLKLGKQFLQNIRVHLLSVLHLGHILQDL